ncbi:Predicted functional analog of homoserine kinase, partial [hydrothermal vent metagenome]
LNDAIGFDEIRLYPGKSYRHLLILKVRDPQAFLNIKTIPPHDILEKDIKEYLPSGKESEMLLKLMETSRTEFSGHPINNVRVDLDENPANMIWLWGQGTRPNLQKFEAKYGIKGAIISAVDLVNGIGKVAGLEIIDVPGITGYYDTNYLGKAEYALKSLEKNDFVYVHVEAPDEAGHNGDVKAKINAIEQIDKHIVGTILNHFDRWDDIRILVAPDHPTPVKLRTHTSDPVGFIQFGKDVEKDEYKTYCEAICNTSKLKYESGEKLLNDFINKHL